jgi:ABC-type multidrug transport system ATPase subunit
LATIRTASVIAVMDKGRIIQRGTHDELLQDKEGLYAGLVSQQLGTPPPPKPPKRQTQEQHVLSNFDTLFQENNDDDDDEDDNSISGDIAQHNQPGISLGF